MDDAMDDLHLTEGFIEQVMTFLVSRSLLVKRTLTNPDTIITIQKEGDNRPQCELAEGGNGQERAEVITSPGIQKRYQEAVKGRKRRFEVNAEIWLLDEEETASCIKVANNKSFSKKNPDNSEKNMSKSKKNNAKESKVNKSKSNKSKSNCSSAAAHREILNKEYSEKDKTELYFNTQLTVAEYDYLYHHIAESEFDNYISRIQNYSKCKSRFETILKWAIDDGNYHD